MNIPKDTMDILMKTIAQRLTPQPIKLRADIELTCFKPAGIDAIKRALKAGEAVSTPTVPVKAKLIAPPFYVLDTNATDKVRPQVNERTNSSLSALFYPWLCVLVLIEPFLARYF
jgi:translation initiation factor 2 alpha subunit (eIF-2alpha)